ncbi:MAG: 3-oxoacyl-[acyl-carrier-protein] reductase FabG [Acidimicrobiales bacterium]|nr:3-oxoacyl-[acyl-carrier-protein] reductase FabG [Acidimicrobiales bacterium]
MPSTTAADSVTRMADLTTPTWNTALVTGASRGIGEAFARELAQRRSNLVVVARDAERLKHLAAELEAAHAVSVEVLAADLVEPDDRGAVEARLSDSRRPVDLLVNNAGFGTTGAFDKLPVEREDEEIQLNVTALVRLTHAVLPQMIERGSGTVLNVSSVAGIVASPGSATYCATKSFVNTFTDSLHEELRGSGVTVTAVLPGFTRTDFQDTASYDAERSIPGFAWLSADDVARAALAGAAAGRARVVPGLYKFVVGAAGPVPPGILRRFVAEMSKRFG